MPGRQLRPVNKTASAVHDDRRAAHLRETDCVAGVRGLELGNPRTSHVFEIL
jgi:hypothetical protein